MSKRRSFERSTKAHNLITINDVNYSDVWSSFRIGKRAKVDLLKNTDSELSITIKYGNFGIIKRDWIMENNEINLIDKFSENKNILLTGRIYLNPKLQIKKLKRNMFSIEKNLIFEFIGDFKNIKLLSYEYGKEFNKRIDANYFKYEFFEKSLLRIYEKSNISN